MKLRDDLVLRQVGDDYLIIDPSQGVVDYSNVFTLNESAALIWRELSGKEFDEDDAVSLIVESYIVDADRARQDVVGILKRFREQKMLID